MQSFSIKDKVGLTVGLSDFGARIISIEVSHEGELAQLACRYKNLEDYAADQFCMGATVGPIANRVAEGQLSIQGQDYQLPRNHSAHCLHSGVLGFDKMAWQCVSHKSDSIEFALSYPQGDHALPGNLEVRITYSVADGQLSIGFSVLTDQATYLNLTNHVYLNLNGYKSNVANHQFTLFADSYAEKNEDDIPTGNTVPINNPLQYRLNDACVYPELQGCVDHHFVVNEDIGDTALKPFARIVSPVSGINLQVSGTQPGFQFYSGHSLSAPFEPFAGFCIEPQFVPNAINLPQFSSPLATPDSPYRHSMTLHFDWAD